MLTDTDAAEKIIEYSKDKTGWKQALVERLKAILARLKKFFKYSNPDSYEGAAGKQLFNECKDLCEKLEKTLVDAVENYQNESSTSQVKEGDKSKDQFAIKNQARKLDNDGISYWQIETKNDIFKSIKDKKDLQKAAYNFILNGYKGEQVKGIIDGKDLKFIRISAKEFVYGRQSQGLDNQTYKQKMRMSTSITDLIENATIQYSAPI